MRLIINADDFGITEGICSSILELIDKGAVTSTSVMIAAHNSKEIFKRISNVREEIVFGAHLQITNGRPISPREKVLSLIDKSTGEFLPKTEISTVVPSEVKIEWKAQIELIQELCKRTISHLDSHHGIHRKLNLQTKYLQLAKEYEVPIRGGTEDELIKFPLPHGIVQTIAINSWTGRGRSWKDLAEILLDFRSRYTEHDILEVVTHPGYTDQELRNVSSLSDLRENDHRQLLELNNSNWLHDNGFELIQFSELLSIN